MQHAGSMVLRRVQQFAHILLGVGVPYQTWSYVDDLLAAMDAQCDGSSPPSSCNVPDSQATHVIWKDLVEHAEAMTSIHLGTLLQDESRNEALFVRSVDGAALDFSHEKVNATIMNLLLKLAESMGVDQKKQRMFSGAKVNEVEGRAALHVALRAPRDSQISVDGRNVVPDVWKVLDSIQDFTDKVRSGAVTGCTGKPLTDVVCIGIGGSYLGAEFLFEALRTEPEAAEASRGRRLRFLANVDPIDVTRSLDGLNAETTLVVVSSKTFTTAETMLNAKTIKQWLMNSLGGGPCLSKHIVACSTAVDKAKDFGIDPANVFPFWDWVGGRFSASSAVGVLPLSLQYGFKVVEKVLLGARSMDEHFLNAKLDENLPVLMAVLAVWNINFLGHPTYAVLPYCQALVRFVAHVQQLDMESNGKRVQMNGRDVTASTGAIYFGEPGTNGQHSFFQLMHQGRTIPAEFIGFKRSQTPIELAGETVSNHDELMSNFFAQPDALAIGRSREDVAASGVPEYLAPHKTFPGDRPSLSLLLPVCNAYWLGQLLALYEHRTVVQGWIWNINSFDQFGVELGKGLAKDVRTFLAAARTGAASAPQFKGSSRKLLAEYMELSDGVRHRSQL